MNLKLHGKESLSVMCHFNAQLPLENVAHQVNPHENLLRETLRLIPNDSPHQQDTEADILLHCVPKNAA